MTNRYTPRVSLHLSFVWDSKLMQCYKAHAGLLQWQKTHLRTLFGRIDALLPLPSQYLTAFPTLSGKGQPSFLSSTQTFGHLAQTCVALSGNIASPKLPVDLFLKPTQWRGTGHQQNKLFPLPGLVYTPVFSLSTWQPPSYPSGWL